GRRHPEWDRLLPPARHRAVARRVSRGQDGQRPVRPPRCQGQHPDPCLVQRLRARRSPGGRGDGLHRGWRRGFSRGAACGEPDPSVLLPGPVPDPGQLRATERSESSLNLWREYDFVLVLFLLMVLILGATAVFSASGPTRSEFYRQVIYMAVGLGALAYFSLVDYRSLGRLYVLTYLGTLALILFV